MMKRKPLVMALTVMNALRHLCFIVGLALLLAPLAAGGEILLAHLAWQQHDLPLYAGSFIGGACLLWFRYLLRRRM